MMASDEGIDSVDNSRSISMFDRYRDWYFRYGRFVYYERTRGPLGVLLFGRCVLG